ncbi:spore germination protein [Ectobacillus sp. JY-23]|uniref:spore germination protein n=1 Tax=Ectobacillus sp. JY-23 TaxID=2933872 RepID=UPI001FF1242A|nr:spore germination protein [Ectobacillus sp. JY-23]UOY91849.1 spore germination protein [Ectobacillus sp. JY-23]
MRERKKNRILEQLHKQFLHSQDLIFKKHEIQGIEMELVYFESLTNSQYLDQFILPRLEGHDVPEKLLRSLFQAEDITGRSIDSISHFLFKGYVLFIFQESVFTIGAGDLPKRAPEESSLETSIRGPKDGFVEDMKTNISLIRRRLHTSSLCVEKYTIGARSNTEVALLYLKDVINQNVLTEIHQRLQKVDIDILTTSHELEAYVDDRRYSIFPTMDYTGRPDFIVEALNQGRFALIVDGSPTVSFAPINLLIQTKSPEDTHLSYTIVSVERFIRVVGIFISAFLPAVWVAFSAYNIEQIPYLLVATISVSRFGLPLPAPIEMFIVLFLFELFNEAGVRLPRAIGQTVAVLGGLIVGDAAIRAGLTSPTMLVIAAITYISSFTLVNQSLSSGITILRFFILILSTFFGLFGVTLGFILTVLYLSTVSSFGVPYLSALAPVSIQEVARAFLRMPGNLYKERAHSTHPNDSTREDGQ